MKKCPNCGQFTARTKDWACPWCGYPLLSRSYRIIPKTYGELKEERLREQRALLGQLAPQPEETSQSQTEVTPRPEPVPELEIKLPPEPEAEPSVKSKHEITTEPEPEQTPEDQLEAVPEPKPTAAGPDVDELFSTLEADKVAAEAQYKDKILKVTGLVYRTVINENMDVDYVILTSAKKYGEWKVTCTFDKKHGQELNRLVEQDTVTVQGKYGGFRANILMHDCVLIK